jgi:hypothetical protein
MYIVSMTKFYDCEKISTDIVIDLHIFDTLEYKKIIFEMLSVCIYVCVHACALMPR